ncbi:MAG: COX15/CtaA family protein [Alphaproteobacteria bacterium]
MHRKLAALTLLLTYLTIVLGAATRVWDAGMSCPDWPTCYGVWNPFHPDAMPVGGYVVNGMVYTVHQVALEWTHRLCAALVGFGLIGLLVGAVRQGRNHPWLPLSAAFVLLALQVKLGALTVWMNNVNWSVAIHLGNAMLMFGALAWYSRTLRAGQGPFKAPAVSSLCKALVVVLPVAVLATMMLGAYVSSSHAGGVCGGLFSCAGNWMPSDIDQLVHMKHRYMALATVVLAVALRLVASNQPSPMPHAARALDGMVLGQVALGIATLYSFEHYAQHYQWLSLGHLAWGTLVWLVAVGTAMNLYYGHAGRAHG